MAKYYSLFGGTTTDTSIQVAKENQIVIGYGPGMSQSRYVIYKVEHGADGYMYHLVNLETKAIRRTDILEAHSKKFGIGLYYTDAPAEFMDAFEVTALVAEAEAKARKEAEEAETKRQQAEQVKSVGRRRFAEILPPGCKGRNRGKTQTGRKRPHDRLFCKQYRPHRCLGLFKAYTGHFLRNA